MAGKLDLRPTSLKMRKKSRNSCLLKEKGKIFSSMLPHGNLNGCSRSVLESRVQNNTF